jgi:uncharacterized membrane protein YbhN (UPF0104 family)
MMTDVSGDAAATPPGARSRLRRTGGLVAGLLILGFVAFALVDGWRRTSKFDWQFHPWLLVFAAVALTGSLGCNGLGYVLILERLAGRRLPRGQLLSVWSRSMLGRYVPGNVLMVTGRVVLGREAGVSGKLSLAASVYEHAFLLGLGAIASIGLLLHLGDLGNGPLLWVVVVVPLGLVILHPKAFAPLSTRALRRFGREPLESFLSERDILLFAGLYSIGYCFLGAGVWATVHALAGPSAGAPLVIGAAFLLSFVVSMVAFVFPSGLGVREGVFALVLARSLPGGVAIAAAAATRLALTVVEIAFATTVMGLQRRRQARASR